MMPFINWARSAGGGLVDKDLPAAIGDCALTVATRRKATTVSGGASLGLDIALQIMPRRWDDTGPPLCLQIQRTPLLCQPCRRPAPWMGCARLASYEVRFRTVGGSPFHRA